jgi:hypothetical protein
MDRQKHPCPTSSAHDNYLANSHKLPDIQYKWNNKIGCIDVAFQQNKDGNMVAFQKKITKYSSSTLTIPGTRDNSTTKFDIIIPLIINYDGTIFEESMKLLVTHHKELTLVFLTKSALQAIIRYHSRAKAHYTYLIQNAIADGRFNSS